MPIANWNANNRMKDFLRDNSRVLLSPKRHPLTPTNLPASPKRVTSAHSKKSLVSNSRLFSPRQGSVKRFNRLATPGPKKLASRMALSP